MTTSFALQLANYHWKAVSTQRSTLGWVGAAFAADIAHNQPD
jgi:hypothetical protein